MINYNDNIIAIIHKRKEYSYINLNEQINIFYSLITNEIKCKDKVIIINSDFNFFSISLLLALSRIPCIIVPIVFINDIDLSNKIKISEGNIIFNFNYNGFDFKIINENKINYQKYKDIIKLENSGLVLFSSGTTGVPKLMVHNFTIIINSIGISKKRKNLIFLQFLLFDHIGGINTLLNCLNLGTTIVLPENRDPESILNLISYHKINVLPTTPTFLNLLLQVKNFNDYDIESLKLITYGTERMPIFLLNKLNLMIKNVKFLQTFGTSETGILKTESKSSNSLYFKITDPDREYKIENNELFIKSKTSISEYKDLLNSSIIDGWFATGDLVETDDDGYIKIIGRKNEVINVGGLKVLPEEIENVVNQIDGILDSTAYAIPNAILGNVVGLNIVIERNINEDFIKKEIKDKCKYTLDKYKIPTRINIKNEITKTNRFKKLN
jgi:acyl-coenzyme A synthetase/AMP-(fatty) acid ligase